MCGIVGGVTNTNIIPLLLKGLNCLEYRGYDSSGLIVLSKDNSFDRARSVGKVKNLEESLKARKHKFLEILGLLIPVGLLMESPLIIMLILIFLKIQ